MTRRLEKAVYCFMFAALWMLLMGLLVALSAITPGFLAHCGIALFGVVLTAWIVLMTCDVVADRCEQLAQVCSEKTP